MSAANVTRAQLHAPFRSRRGRVIGWSAAIAQAVVIVTVAALLPWDGPSPIGWNDRLGFVAVAAFLAWGLTRFALVAATPSEEGLVVRNLLITRRLEWAQIVGINYGNGAPWVTLDLSDADTLAVMAIQRADGKQADAQARRLATLIALHSARPQHD